MSSPRSIVRAAARGNRPKHRLVAVSDSNSSQRRDSIPTRNLRKPDPETITGPVYVASPLSTYDTLEYDSRLKRLATLLPNADLLAARNLFTSNAEWRRRWPGILPTLAALVFFDDADGCIGAGVEREIVGAHGLGIPVYFLPGPPVDALVPCDDTGRVEFWPVYGQGWRQTLRVCHAVPASDARALLSKGGA